MVQEFSIEHHDGQVADKREYNGQQGRPQSNFTGGLFK